ncbi:MAG: class B sortase [Clostridia bacterium]|nr:class B sortase [Clostridia bacterium]
MTEEKDYGTMSPSFNDLIRKYQAINEDGEVSKEAVQEIPEPELKSDKDFEKELGEIIDSVEQPEQALPEEFTFDEALIPETEEAPEPEMVFKKEEPKFAYDLNMFGAAAQSSFNIDDIDDSWLDSSLDESIFYDPSKPKAYAPVETAEEFVPEAQELPEEVIEEVIEEAAQETAEEIQPEPVEEEIEETVIEEIAEEAAEEEPQPVVEEIHKEPAFIPVAEPVEPQPAMVAGGYIAPSDADSFTFDPDSGLDFDEDEEPKLPEMPSDLPVFTPAVPDEKKNKKLGKKKETKAVTSFSKDYMVGGDEGKPVKRGNFFTRNFIPSKDDSAAEKVRKIVMVIAVIAALVSGGYLFNDYVIAPYMNTKQLDELSDMIGEGNNVADAKSLAEKYPGVAFPEGMLEKYAALYARNKDFVGWIEIDGLDISLPVVRGDNNDKYLKTDFDGKYSKYGSIFMNCANKVDSLNYNTTIFGHYMKDTKMFGNLMQYKSIAGYKKAPVIEFNTIYGDYKWKVFAAYITNGTSAGDDGYLFNYMFTDLSTNEAVEEFLGEIKLRTIYYPNVDLAVSDRILTLSTCTYELDEGRLIVMARAVRPGESTDVDLTNIRVNPNPRYPQGYYTEQNLSNPYKSYNKWYPS